MKQREYKNFKYISNNHEKCKAIYYKCRCGGRLHYNSGMSIKEMRKHTCVEPGKVIDLIAVRNNHFYKNVMFCNKFFKQKFLNTNLLQKYYRVICINPDAGKNLEIGKKHFQVANFP